MDILSNISQQLTPLFEAFIASVSEGKFRNILAAARDLIREAVKGVEQISTELKEVGAPLSGPEKHQMVMEYMVGVVVQRVNERINIPFLNEAQEEALFRMILNALIRQVVRKLNQEGWH